MRANSMIDVALWDIRGKVIGQPLYAMLGGATRDRVQVYNTCAGPDYVSKSSDVRPGNFGLTDEAPRAGSRGTTVFFVHPKSRAEDGFGYLIEMVEEGK